VGRSAAALGADPEPQGSAAVTGCSAWRPDVGEGCRRRAAGAAANAAESRRRGVEAGADDTGSVRQCPL